MNQQEFLRRRHKLIEHMGPNSIAILPSSPIRQRNRDVDYPYRPDSDFYYLTGFPEPEAVAVLIPGRDKGEYLIFCRERDQSTEIWNGSMAGLEGACQQFQANDAFPINDIDDILPGLMEGKQRVYYAMGCNNDFDQKVMAWLNILRKKGRSGIHTPSEIIALDHHLHDMRLFKSTAEIKLMRKAAEISALAHKKAMQICQPGLKEYQLDSEINYIFTHHGAHSPAYPSIVGSGSNACTLHYIENMDTVRDGDLVLIDAGAEYQYYAADITRTFPVNGKFSNHQRALYQIVLDAQYAAIAEVKPGNHWDQPHNAAVKVIAKGLHELGILKGSVKNIIEKEKYKRFYMHRTGHWLGMDVHDVGEYKEGEAWRVLEPGMTLTVEPGIYIAPESENVAKKWWGIGIRIEDDVLVTKDGCEVLSAGVPKEVDEIEKLCLSLMEKNSTGRYLVREGDSN